MSRYYKITVSPPDASLVGQAGETSNPIATSVWTNKVNGQADPGAQTVEFDIPFCTFDAPVGAAHVKIWGPSREQIAQASDFNGSKIMVEAGMQSGLPIATAEASQAGPILSGMILQAFGNWQGLNMTLDFVVTSDGGATQAAPGNLSFTWRKGKALGDVLQTQLNIAYPNVTTNVFISPSLVATQDTPGVYQTLQQLATWAKGVSQDIIKTPGYLGVSITTLQDGSIIVSDGTQDTSLISANSSSNLVSGTGSPGSSGAVPINAFDLIGAPTWIDAATIQFTTTLRSDIAVLSQVTLPAYLAAQAVTNANSGSNVRLKNTFTGTWTVKYARHVGNSRSPDPQSWVTVFQAVSNATPDDTAVDNTSA